MDYKKFNNESYPRTIGLDFLMSRLIFDNLWYIALRLKIPENLLRNPCKDG